MATKCKTCGKESKFIVRVGNGKGKADDECCDCYVARLKAQIKSVKNENGKDSSEGSLPAGNMPKD